MKCFLEALVSLGNLDLLAQEGLPLTPCIDKDDRQQRSHRDKKKHFHAHRIARTGQLVLYSEFAFAKQI
jgi:hypothetical protein